MQEGEVRGSWSEASPGQTHGTLSENKLKHRAGGVAQVVDCLSSKYDTLSSNPSTTHTKRYVRHC
jgi:hypothetical protein